MPNTRRLGMEATVLLLAVAACAPQPTTILPASMAPIAAAVQPAGVSRYEALVDPAAHTVTVSPVGMHTQAAGVWVRSANAVWNAPTFSFDLLVTNNSGTAMNPACGVVLSTTPGAPTVTPAGTDGTLPTGEPFYNYGTIANGSTGSRNWQFSVPSVTPFRFGFTIQQGAGVDAAPQKNNAPAVVSVNPASPTVAAGGSTTITATSSDPNGDGVTYAWSAPNGGTISGSGATITYTAPGSTGTYPVNVTIDDGKGATATGSTDIAVTPGGGNGTAQGNVSFGPAGAASVKRVTLSPATVTINPGDPLAVTATGLDNPGNSVPTTWTWSQVGTTSGTPWRGTFDQGTGGNVASWRTFDGRTDAGPVTVTARAANNQTGSMTINVREVAPVITSRSPAATVTVPRNTAQTFTCVFHDGNGNNNTIADVAITPNTNHSGYSYNYVADYDGNMTFTLTVYGFTAVGTKTLTVTNSDGTNATTMTWNITIV